MKSSKALKNLTAGGLFAALILIATYFHTPMPNANGGYIHVGDAIIYLCASMLPLGYSAVAAAIGGALCDIISGYTIYAPATLVIKVLLCLSFTSKGTKLLSKRNFIAAMLGIVITIGGYYLAESIIYQSFVSPLASITGNLVQSVGSLVIYVVVALAFDRSKVKKKLGF